MGQVMYDGRQGAGHVAQTAHFDERIGFGGQKQYA